MFAAATSTLRLHDAPSRAARVTSTMAVSPGERERPQEGRRISRRSFGALHARKHESISHRWGNHFTDRKSRGDQ